MKKYRNIVMAALCALSLIVTVTACGGSEDPSATTPAVTTAAAPTETPEETTTETPAEAPQSDLPLLSQGIFEYELNGGDSGIFANYIHFYPSGVFYASMYNGSQFAAGYYELKDEPLEYTDKEGNVVNAPQTLLLTTVDGAVYETLGYDADKGTIGIVTHIYDNVFTQNKESTHTDADENGVALIEYKLGDDEYSLLKFMHNGTFQDTIGEMLEGTWTKDGDIYTLTEADSEKTYTFTVNADGTGAYAGLDGKTETLNIVKAAEVQVTFTGTTTATYGDMIVVVECLTDGTLVRNIIYGGQENKENGTWALAADYSHIALNFGGADYTAPLNQADNSFAFDFTTNDGAADVTVTLSTVQAVTTLYTWTGENNPALIAEFYSNGTLAVIYTGMGNVTAGTWELDAGAAPMPKWTVTLDETFESAATEVTTDYATKYSFTFKNATGQLEDTLSLPFADLN